MLWVLDALWFFQKQLQVDLCDYRLLDVVFNWIIAFTDIIIYDKLPCAVVVVNALRNQKRLLCEIVREVFAEKDNQLRRGAAAIGLPDFFHNVRLNNFKRVCHLKSGKVQRFQLSVYDSPQQV